MENSIIYTNQKFDYYATKNLSFNRPHKVHGLDLNMSEFIQVQKLSINTSYTNHDHQKAKQKKLFSDDTEKRVQKETSQTIPKNAFKKETSQTIPKSVQTRGVF